MWWLMILGGAMESTYTFIIVSYFLARCGTSFLALIGEQVHGKYDRWEYRYGV